MMATRVVGGLDEKETCVATRTDRMRLCATRAIWAASGWGERGFSPGTCSVFIDSSLRAANEDQAARTGFCEKNSIVTVSRCWVPRSADGWRRKVHPVHLSSCIPCITLLAAAMAPQRRAAFTSPRRPKVTNAQLYYNCSERARAEAGVWAA